jgi:hypothetical protein
VRGQFGHMCGMGLGGDEMGVMAHVWQGGEMGVMAHLAQALRGTRSVLWHMRGRRAT